MERPDDRMELERYCREVTNIRLDPLRKTQLTEELKAHVPESTTSLPSLEHVETVHRQAYLPSIEEQTSGSRDIRRFWQWGGLAAAAVLAVVLALVLFPAVRRPTVSAGLGTAETGGQPVRSYPAPASSVTATTSAGTTGSTAGKSGTTTAATNHASTTQRTAGFTSMSYRPLPTIAVSDPLDILYNGFNGIYEITQQQMLDLFHAIDSLDVIMDMGEIAYNMAFYDDHALTFRGVRGGMQLYYQIVECYDTGVMELRLIEEGHPDYQVLDSKPLPPGRDYYEAYDRYVRLVWPSCCITTDLLEAIMREGHLAPFMKNDELTSGMTLSDDYMLLRFEFYMTDLRKTVFIHEDYRTRDIYYTVYEPGIVPELESTTRDGQAPLKTGAKRSDYTMFSATFESLDSE